MEVLKDSPEFFHIERYMQKSSDVTRSRVMRKPEISGSRSGTQAKQQNKVMKIRSLRTKQ